MSEQVKPASEQKPFAWFAKNDITDLLEIEWTTSKPIYEGIWEPLFRKPYESFCHEERPCIPCFTDNGPCADAPDYKAQRDALMELLEQSGKALESMVQYSQDSHDEPPFPASALDYEAYQLSCEIVSAIVSVKGGE